MTRAVPGVTGLVDRLTVDVDETGAAPVPAPRRDRLHGWWTGRQLVRHAG